MEYGVHLPLIGFDDTPVTLQRFSRSRKPPSGLASGRSAPTTTWCSRSRGSMGRRRWLRC